MKKVSKFSAIEIFREYERLENRLPTKAEWEMEWFGRVCRRNENNYYYQVKKKFLEECEAK
jgi:hypothetical protein